MKIILGIGYDNRHPSDLSPLLGSVICGEVSILNQLESRACIVQPRQSIAARSVIYLKALLSANNTTRFYTSSLSVDPISTASTILNWRDWAHLHGWVPASNPQLERLNDLAEVESALDGLSPSIGERLVNLMPHADLISRNISNITLHDPKFAWPLLYQQLFDTLEQAGIEIVVETLALSPPSPKGCDLYDLQTRLICNIQGEATTPTVFKNDGSLAIYQVSNQQAGAQYLCEKNLAIGNHLIIASDHLYQLNEAAFQLSYEELGLGEVSRWRAPQQLLPLLLSLAWQPPDANRILEYLTLPAGPHRTLRGQITKYFSDLPGYDSQCWSNEIERYIELRKEDNEDLDVQQLQSDISNWLPIGIANSATLMPIDIAITLSDQVTKYWGARIAFAKNTSESTLFSAAQEAANALSDALREWHDTDISRVQLNRLIDIATDHSATTYSGVRTVSELNIINSPSTSRLNLNSLHHLSWWGFRSEDTFFEPPFQADEYSALPLAPDDDVRAQQRRHALSRSIEPILRTHSSATLIMLGNTRDILCEQALNIFGIDTPPVLDGAILEGQVNDVQQTAIEPLRLPIAQRWWHINHSIPAPREIESYSSLTACALRPHEYVLRYTAQLFSGSLKGLPIDARLLGNLGHRVIETWFTQHECDFTATTINSVETWVDNHLDALIMQYALPLSAAGQRAERLLFADQITHALTSLLNHLNSAHVVNIHIERQLSCQIDTHALEGIVDILAELPDKRFVIIDVKFGSQSRYESELREGQYLQLATYSKLAITSSDMQIEIADVAYFILKTGELLTCTNKIFPNAKIIEPKNTAVTPNTIWQQLYATTHWRIEQLNAGVTEITYTQETITENSIPPESCLPVTDIESASQGNQPFGFRQTFKIIDPWRVLVGKLEE